jgi:hypothetical protein
MDEAGGRRHNVVHTNSNEQGVVKPASVEQAAVLAAGQRRGSVVYTRPTS